MQAHSIEFLNEMPKSLRKTILNNVKPEEIAQQMEIATACAYALKDARIAKAKAECAARMQRKLAKEQQAKNETSH